MKIVENLENLITTWKERRIYQGLQAKEALALGDTKLQATLINNRKQIGNCILDLMEVLKIEKERDKTWGAFVSDSRRRLENALNADRMY